MRNRSRTCLAALLAFGVAVAACEAEEAQVEEGEMAEGTVSAEEELEELRVTYEEAYNRADMPALAALHSKDYVEVSPEGEVVTRADVDAMTQEALAGQQISIETESMTVAESGDIAYGTGITTITGTGPDGQPFTAESRWLAGFKKQDGEWKVDRLITTDGGEGAMTEEDMAPTDTAPADTVETM